MAWYDEPDRYDDPDVVECPACEGAGCSVCDHDGVIDAATAELWHEEHEPGRLEQEEPEQLSLFPVSNPGEDVSPRVESLYEMFHGVEPVLVVEGRMWVPGDLTLLGPCVDVGYHVIERRSTKSGRYVHDHEKAVKVYKRARSNDKITKRYKRFPAELAVLGTGIGFTYRDATGHEVEVAGSRSVKLCTNAQGNMLVLVGPSGVDYVICGGSMHVADWIYD